MKAQEAIDQIKDATTTFMGVEVNAHNYSIDIRERLQVMGESGTLSPSEYWHSLVLTWPEMSESEKLAEVDDLS